MRHYAQNTALLIASFVVALILLELGLRLFTPFPITQTSNQLEDSRLGYTLNPALEDVDEHGFRNTADKLEDAELAIIGDSFAYGVNVTSENNFPSILANKTGRKVYNFGVGSYGIYQYKILIDDVLQYSFKDVVLALYPANDLRNHCRVLSADFWRNYIKDTGLLVPECRKSQPPNPSITVERLLGALKWRISNTATLQIINNLRQRMSDRDEGLSRFDNEEIYKLDQDQFVSKTSVNGHSRSTSFDDFDVRTNFENSKTFLIDGKEKLASASIGFVVVIIPSRERVLYEWMMGRNRKVPDDFRSLLENEVTLTREYKSFFEETDIAYVDALSDVVLALTETLSEGGKFYPLNDDHPYRPGYEAFSEAAFGALENSVK